MTQTNNTLKAAFLAIDGIALDLETVPREPDSVVDRIIAKLRNLSRLASPFKRDAFQSRDRIEAYRSLLIEYAADLKALTQDTPGGTIASAMDDMLNVSEYLLGCASKHSATLEVCASVRVPPSLQGEPAYALDKPAVVRVQKTGDAFADGLAKVVVASCEKKDASKGESIVQACAQIRGAVAGSPSVSVIPFILNAVDQIEAQAFAKDTPTFALNSNGNPLDDEQVELIRCIKEARRELISLANRTQQYLMAKQKRLKATCDANPCNDIDHEFTEAQAAAYAAYAAFGEAQGYGWVDRGVSDVQVGVMALVRAVAGPTE